jgi:hypothetical protein
MKSTPGAFRAQTLPVRIIPVSKLEMTTLVRGPQEKMSFFQIASGPILSIPIYLKTCLYGPCKFLLKKYYPFLTYEPPIVSVFFVIVTGLVTQLASLVNEPLLAFLLGISMYLSRILVV